MITFCLDFLLDFEWLLTEFSTFYTTIPRAQLKSRLKEFIQRCFSNKNGEQRYQYLVIGRDKYYSVKSHSKSNKKSKQNVIIQILDFDD
jgi:hypothetical protein